MSQVGKYVLKTEIYLTREKFYYPRRDFPGLNSLLKVKSTNSLLVKNMSNVKILSEGFLVTKLFQMDGIHYNYYPCFN